MRQKGFTLIEVLVVMLIFGTLLALGTLNFSDMMKKAQIESQIKKMFADLQTVRAQAMFMKRERTVALSSSQFNIYSSNVAAGTPVMQNRLNYPVRLTATAQITFDTMGLSDTNGSICIEPVSGSNPAAVDSIVVFTTRVQLGKRKDGGACNSDDIITR